MQEGPVVILREGDQFELRLFPGEPWEGRSPRSLTRGWKALFLKPEAPSHELRTDELQLDLFWPPKKAVQERRLRRDCAGAPFV